MCHHQLTDENTLQATIETRPPRFRTTPRTPKLGVGGGEECNPTQHRLAPCFGICLANDKEHLSLVRVMLPNLFLFTKLITNIRCRIKIDFLDLNRKER